MPRSMWNFLGGSLKPKTYLFPDSVSHAGNRLHVGIQVNRQLGHCASHFALHLCGCNKGHASLIFPHTLPGCFSLSCAAGFPGSATTPSTAFMGIRESELRLVSGAGYAKCMTARSNDGHFAHFQQKHGQVRQPDYMPMRLNASEFQLPNIHGTSPAKDKCDAEVCESLSSPGRFGGGATVRE
jgi:hypothetical protein